MIGSVELTQLDRAGCEPLGTTGSKKRRGGAMKRFLLVLTLCLTLFAWPTLAQEEPTLSALEISLWPEFDQPEVLVIYRGVLAEDVSLPAAVEILIPASAGPPTAVAYVGEGGQRFNQPHTTREEGDWIVVSFDLETRGFQLEYYDAMSVDADDQRTFTFDFVADYVTAGLELDFQEPPTASAFTLEPPADSVIQESDGLTYHVVQADSLAAGDEQSWTFSYQKDNEDLTVGLFMQPETPAPQPTAAAGGEDNSAVLIFLIAFVALVAVGAAAFWLGSRTQTDEPPPPPKQRKRRGSGRGAQPFSPPSRDESFFCHKCGSQLRSDSDFCHKCGATVRKV